MRRLILPAMLLLSSCSVNVSRSIREIGKDSITANLGLPEDEGLYNPIFDSLMNRPSSDTLTVMDQYGNRLHLMKAVMDSSGTLNSTEILNPAIITASFRNVAERNGMVNIAFQVRIPAILQNPEWQLIMTPKAVIKEDTLDLEDIVVTGEKFRERQLRGYELYNRFLARIITDSSELMHMELLEIFIARNIPGLAKIKNDTAYVNPDEVRGIFGITCQEAREYFKRRLRITLNDRKVSSVPKKYAKYVIDPYIVDGIRIDTIVTEYGNELVYNYIQEFRTRPGLKRIDLSVDGSIRFNGEEKISLPHSGKLTFYIASFSTMAEHQERFITKVIERKAMVNFSSSLSFLPGEYSIDESLDSNSQELEILKHNVARLIENEEYNIDSLVITASCSPEGTYETNRYLSEMRGRSIENYFREFAAEYSASADSADHEKYGYFLDGSPSLSGLQLSENAPVRLTDFGFVLKNIPEDWNGLLDLIYKDTVLKDKSGIMELCRDSNPDTREKKLSAHEEYPYIFEKLYPELRNVRFDFHLHRKGMIKDTIHTKVPDTLYYKGVQAIKDMDYKLAVKCLGPYADINTALAYLAMDYNASAMNVLEKLPPSGKRDYLLAIAHSRGGNEQQAVQYFMNSVGYDPAMAFRGNLDPEISSLIKKYNIGLN